MTHANIKNIEHIKVNQRGVGFLHRKFPDVICRNHESINPRKAYILLVNFGVQYRKAYLQTDLFTDSKPF